MTKLYGLKISYFTGKMEGYLRYKEIPFEFCSMTATDFNRKIPDKTGAMQMPAIELADNRWMTDTSPMIDWFELQYPDNPILPEDPSQAFICRLIEDYADEWLWRPAMHYRWSYPASSKLLRRQIADEMATDVKIPKWLVRMSIEKRQCSNFVIKDGVTKENLDHVERGYLQLLKILSTIFKDRPFIFGDKPTLADIGLFGPLFRHFSQDPIPGEIMRETAPTVIEWVYRLWNAKASRLDGSQASGIPENILPLLQEVGQTHLENLCANAEAWSKRNTTFDVCIQGANYANVPTSRYRVWCLEKLQQRFRCLDQSTQDILQSLLEQHDCFEPLFRLTNTESGYDNHGTVPFGRSIPVYEHVRG